ncbi:MAG: PaaI family thioesterase [Rhodobacteraceae bacterium]|nr:PaaI family thioesterase [Paracoccaceae bacterium]
MTSTLSDLQAAAIRDSFARQGLMTTLRAELTELAHGHCVIAAPILPLAQQQNGFGHAGLSFSVGDSAAGYAAMSVMPDGYEVLSIEVKINLLASAKGDRLIATGRVARAGRRIVVVQADICAESDGETKLIAILQGTMMPVPPA